MSAPRPHPLVVCASHSPAMERDSERRNGLVFRRGLAAARRAVTEFDPDLVVVFAPDHRRALREIVPAFTVVASARGLGDAGGDTSVYSVDRDAADALAAHLFRAGFDPALARGIRLDHGTGQTLTDLVGGLDTRPTLPILVNCATPPLAPMWRVQRFGVEVGEFVRTLRRSVLVIGSGGLSHAPPSLAPHMIHADDATRVEANARDRDAAARVIAPTWDHALLEAFNRDDRHWLARLTDERIDPAGWGAHEIRTWVAAHAAGSGGLASVYEPVPDWITGMAVGVTAGAATLTNESDA